MFKAMGLIVLVFAGGLNASAFSSGSATDPDVVAKVDFQRYVGKWFEIAHSPNFFQRNCIRSTAEYAIESADRISVHNVCYRASGSVSDISGSAFVVDPAVPAKLKVRFNFFARGDYWITELDPNYQWAVVSGPAKKSIFILSRTAPMQPEVLASILETLKSKGYRTDHLVFDQYQ